MRSGVQEFRKSKVGELGKCGDPEYRRCEIGSLGDVELCSFSRCGDQEFRRSLVQHFWSSGV